MSFFCFRFRIWEKKFGRNANHVKKQREEEKAGAIAKELAAKARAAQRLAATETGAGTRRGRGQGRGGGFVAPSSQIPSRLDGGWKGGAENRKATEGRGAGAVGGKKSAAPPMEAKLHPSWEAKRKLKEKEQIGIVPAQGKKIKF